MQLVDMIKFQGLSEICPICECDQIEDTCSLRKPASFFAPGSSESHFLIDYSKYSTLRGEFYLINKEA